MKPQAANRACPLQTIAAPFTLLALRKEKSLHARTFA
jgi:hypothetical protein